tara:strand:+ start:2217 stop:2405 length:189 start_codon:yes stop_codon:yes gene_type:complete
MTNEDFEKNIRKMFLQLECAFREVKDNVVENFGSNKTSELLGCLAEVCNVMVLDLSSSSEKE